MQDSRNLPDPNADLFVSHIDFRALNEHRDVSTGLRVLGRVIYSTEARRKFSQMLDRFAPDVVHLQSIHSHITPSIIIEAKKRGLPVVWTLHDYKLICPNSTFLIDRTSQVCEACGKGSYYQPMLKRCKKGDLLASGMAGLEAYAHRMMGVLKHVDAFLPPSIFMKNKLVDCGILPEKIFHLPHLLPPELLRLAEGNGNYLLFFGRLEQIKGIRPLLEACRLVPDLKLILAGRVETPLANELPNLLPANAEYVGMKHGEALWTLISNATAVIVPSLWYENQPLSILEAFASGKPVIASDLGGMKELVIPQERGLLVPPGDAEALAKAMRWMVANPGKAKEMGQAAQRYALDQHGSELHYQRLMGVYAQVRGKVTPGV
jgi:glycosyltransferase involved in cell wall biosynthesis